MMMDKMFFKSTDGSLGRSITFIEVKYMYRVRVYVTKNKIMSIHDGNGPRWKWTLNGAHAQVYLKSYFGVLSLI
jgi:hypothetical protein